MAGRAKLLWVQTASAVVCVSNDGYEASLEMRKIYRALTDRQAAAEGLIRVIDESGEDYLYPPAMFRPITLSVTLRRALRLAGGAGG